MVGSFLTKDLHLDWRLGEAHFMEHLVDGDMAANNGNWQWIASVGMDPKPYFQRLFNPMLQQRSSTPTASTCAAGCPSWPTCPTHTWSSPGP